ncbi:MAG: glycosyltransferase family 4 protein [Blastocatellia bacterium]|nr:glycosyltransferase family 4 protein [Blastocatellia bacterium]
MKDESFSEDVDSSFIPHPSSFETALLLDLSGDKRAADEWAARHLKGLEIKPLNKADLKWESTASALARVRALAPDTFAVFTSSLDRQSARSALILFGALAGARRIVIGDRSGRRLERSRLTALIFESLRFAFEILAGYLLIVPLSWLLTLLLASSLGVRAVTRKESLRASITRHARRDSHPEASRTALYIRATIASAREGGMSTHVAGFASGAASLGHRLKFIVSAGVPGESQASEADDCISIKPSAALSATRAIFELWNNLVFTLRCLRMVEVRKKSLCGKISPDEIDFIYQRYSRFNWTGVALSIITGLPLILEFNGSEVWVSKRWDPVGQLRLLKRFERLNERAADFLCVVSEVERRNLIRAGVAPEKIIVNPNGVDTDRFRPGSGGFEVRRALGIENKIVVGFLGTFGPWHGAPILAEAAAKVSDRNDTLYCANCHFLFIGDGDQRAEAEAIIESAAVSERATFAGRIPHEKVPAYLDACDILASPHVESADGSEFFGSPTKLFEYMAMSRPVVASRLGQIADLLLDGENGLLVEPGDPLALARAIETLAKDRSLRERLGAAARETASVIAHSSRFSWSST